MLKKFIIRSTAGEELSIEALSFTDALIQYNTDILNEGKIAQDIWKIN